MRKLAIVSGGFAAGIFLAQYLLPKEMLLWAALVCLLLGGAAWILPVFVRRRVLLICVGLSVALGYDWLYVRQVQQPMLPLVDTVAELTMTLQDYPVETAYGTKVRVKAEGLPGGLVYYGSEALRELQPGQIVTASVYVQDASNIRDTDVTVFTSKGVFLLAYQEGEETICSDAETSLRWWPKRMGYVLRRQIHALFPADIAGFLAAMLTGDQSNLPEEAGVALSEAGMYHILAVSGMHCGYLLMFLILLIGRHRKVLVAITAIPILLCYAVLTGSSPSVVRACFMLSMLIAAPIFGRESDGPTSLLAALLVILLQNPFAIASVSLQLSFAAVAGLLWLTPRMYRFLLGEKKRGRVYAHVAAGISTTMGALVFSLPISAWYFGTVSLISPLSNLLCLWAVGIAFVWGLLAVLVSFVCWPAAALLGMVPHILVRYLLWCTALLADIPFHSVHSANPYLKYWLVLVYLLFGAVFVWKRKNRRKYILAAGLTVVTLCAVVWLGQRPYRNDLDILVLDVGQGQSVALASDGEYLLADCGTGNSWQDAGKTAACQLQTMGCQKLRYLLLTHYDADHVSGVSGLLARMDVETLLVPDVQDDTGLRDWIYETAEKHHVKIQVIREPLRFSLGRAEITVFPPVGGAGDNERGLAVLANVGEQDFLLTGDMDSNTERRLLVRYDLSDVEILMAGHHGAKKSTSIGLLQRLRPEVVCISVGSNHYGHPAKETLRRLEEHSCAVYRTDLQGMIHVFMNEGVQYGIREEREEKE